MDQESKPHRKRPLDDPVSHSPDSKLFRVESVGNSHILCESQLDSEVCLNSCNSAFHLVDSDDSCVNSPDAKRIQDDLLDILDESDDPTIQGLDSVMRSFEEEIVTVPGPDMPSTASNTDAYQPELGYLLEASDDELGLPPTFSCENNIRALDFTTETSVSGAAGFEEMLGFQDEIPSYDSFVFGLADESSGNSYNVSYNDGGDFVALGGLFDYSEDQYATATDISAGQWQPESLSAL